MGDPFTTIVTQLEASGQRPSKPEKLQKPEEKKPKEGWLDRESRKDQCKIIGAINDVLAENHRKPFRDNKHSLAGMWVGDKKPPKKGR